MPGTFSQIYLQVVFAVRGRENLISNNWKTELHKYIAGIIKGKGHKPIIVNGMPDHIHAFVGLKPVASCSLSILVLKASCLKQVPCLLYFQKQDYFKFNSNSNIFIKIAIITSKLTRM